MELRRGLNNYKDFAGPSGCNGRDREAERERERERKHTHTHTKTKTEREREMLSYLVFPTFL